MDTQTILQSLLLGLIEGLTEFIPVSSTGHLLLAQVALGLKGPEWETFTVLIQLGAILAVVVVYFTRLWNVVIALPSDPEGAALCAHRHPRMPTGFCAWASCCTTTSRNTCSRALS